MRPHDPEPTGSTESARSDPHDVPTMTARPALMAADDDRAGEVPVEGTRVGRYLVLRHVAGGGMGDVYEAFDPDLGRRVAIKLLRPRGDGETGRLRLAREAQALAQVAHPNVIAVHDVGTWGSSVFVAMELVEGTTVKRWLASEPRTPRAILDVFAAAGRGLAATHRAGLVHRDVKPSNLIVGADGRVRVLDFGLARAGSREPSTPSSHGGAPVDAGDGPIHAGGSGGSTESGSDASRGSELLDTELTRAGDVVGTPQYMSPEQSAGRSTDARSDQFSFCVALYRALWNRLPFAGRDIASQHVAAAAGRIEAPPRRAGVPRRVRRAVLRGLAADPAARFATMDELVAQLERRSRLRRVATVAGIAATAAALATAVTAAGTGPTRPRCDELGDDVAAVWTAADRSALVGAFAATGRSHAASTATRVTGALDRYAGALTTMQVAACKATHERGLQSAELLDLRVHCLDRRRLALGALVDVLRDQPTAAVVDDATTAALELPPVEACADAAALRAAVPRPTAPLERARIEAVERELARGVALADAGRHGDARGVATAAAAEARRLAYPPLEAEALFALGTSLDELGEGGPARQTLLDAAERAAAGHDDRLAARIWSQLVWTLGVTLQARDESGLARRMAEAAVARVDQPPRLVGELAARVGGLALVGGDYQAAEAAYRRALTLLEPLVATGEVAVPRIARVRGGLAAAIASQARFTEAAPLFVAALAELEAVLGPEHPQLAGILANLGLLRDRLGKPALAMPLHERSLVLTERALGPEHPTIVNILNNLSSVYRKLGHPDRSQAALERALRIEQLPGRPGTDLGYIEASLASLFAERGRLDEAAAMAAAARAHLIASLGADHPDVGYADRGIAAVLARRDRWSEAMAELAIASRRVAKAGETVRAELANETGRWRIASGRPREAIAILDATIAELTAAALVDTPEAASALLWRGVARAAAGDTAGGSADAERAFAAVTALGLADLVDAGALAVGLGDVRLRAGDAASARDAYRSALAVLPAEHIEVPTARLGLAEAALALGDRAAAAAALAGLDAHPGLVASPGTSARWRTLAARAR